MSLILAPLVFSSLPPAPSKGQCHEISDFWFFHESVSPKPLSILLGPVSLTPVLPLVSTTLAKLVAKFAAGVVDTVGKFVAGVVDTGGAP